MQKFPVIKHLNNVENLMVIPINVTESAIQRIFSLDS